MPTIVRFEDYISDEKCFNPREFKPCTFLHDERCMVFGVVDHTNTGWPRRHKKCLAAFPSEELVG